MSAQHNYLDHASLLLDTVIILRELEITLSKAKQLHSEYIDAYSKSGILTLHDMRALNLINTESTYEHY
jgi:hypothetical protein